MAFTNKDYAGTIPALEKQALDLNRFFVYKESNNNLKTAIFDLNPIISISNEEIAGCDGKDEIECLELGSLEITATLPAKINAKLPKCYESEKKDDSMMIDMREIAVANANAKIARGFSEVIAQAGNASYNTHILDNVKDKLVASIKELSAKGVPINQMTILIKEDLSLDLKALEIQYSDYNIVTADKKNFTILNGLGVKDIASVPSAILNYGAKLPADFIDFLIYVPSRTPLHIFCDKPLRLVKFNDVNVGETTKVDGYSQVGAKTATECIKVFTQPPFEPGILEASKTAPSKEIAKSTK